MTLLPIKTTCLLFVTVAGAFTEKHFKNKLKPPIGNSFECHKEFFLTATCVATVTNKANVDLCQAAFNMHNKITPPLKLICFDQNLVIPWVPETFHMSVQSQHKFTQGRKENLTYPNVCSQSYASDGYLEVPTAPWTRFQNDCNLIKALCALLDIALETGHLIWKGWKWMRPRYVWLNKRGIPWSVVSVTWRRSSCVLIPLA